jgi:hypothetical protein
MSRFPDTKLDNLPEKENQVAAGCRHFLPATDLSGKSTRLNEL